MNPMVETEDISALKNEEEPECESNGYLQGYPNIPNLKYPLSYHNHPKSLWKKPISFTSTVACRISEYSASPSGFSYLSTVSIP